MKLLELKDRLGDSGMDLLWQLLDLDPSTRISGEAALEHPFFDSERDVGTEITVSYIGNYQGNLPKQHFKYFASMMHSNELRLRPAPNFMTKQN
jgi:hypothetical protein